MIFAEKVDWLRAHGFVVGPRDPRLNTAFTGNFMVAEAFNEPVTPNEDASTGPWCIVGDNLHVLVNEAYEQNFVEVPAGMSQC